MSVATPLVQTFFDPATGTFSYVVADPVTRLAAIIDPVLDYDAVTRSTSARSAQGLLDHVSKNALVVHWILETHAHADHLSAAQWLKERLPAARVGIGEGIRQVQAAFKNKLGLEADFPTDGRQFDVLLGENERLAMGSLEIRVMSTPGHTPDSVSYLIGDAAFVGDTIFAPRYGTARCDFPGGDAGILYDSMQRLLRLPASTRVFLCHDYPPEGVSPQHLTDPVSLRDQNIHLPDGVTREQFVAMREARDATLNEPRLLEASLRANVRAGRLDDAYFRR
ncbi:MAG: MBL fold metallo-hydrolase [Gammaproteobacteria bacterium]|jgi:glyoxylase-like metal-dependent hydrolase (beta-lactamase superfamily II)|nr:MBL fold metallo-hydrolase [Gammaproteobacteria bacterium]